MTYTCTGSDNGNETFSTPGAGFQFDLGPAYLLDDNTGTPSAPAFTINVHDGQDGNVHLFGSSHITNNEDGIGLQLNFSEDGSNVSINVDQPSEDGGGEISGTTGIQINGNLHGGSITIVNDGHVEGTVGPGLEVSGGLATSVTNSSYSSMIGATDGVSLHDIPSVSYDNSGGLTAGLNGDGAHFFNIDTGGTNATTFAVDVRNGHGGVFAGTNNGIRIDNVGAVNEDGEDVRINNAGDANNAFSGGLIVGRSGDGVQVSDAFGNVIISNDYTKQGSIDLSQLDPLVSNTGNSLLFPGGTAVLPSGFSNGIWGNEDGLNLFNIARTVGVSNIRGRIVGLNEDGIRLNDVNEDGLSTDLAVNIDNHGFSGALGGGLIWGGESGIVGVAIDGNVNINNDLGTIFGAGNGRITISVAGDGVFLADVLGNASLSNRGGLTFGYTGDGVRWFNIDGMAGVTNGGGSEGELGIVLGFRSGVAISSNTIQIDNFSRGAILGGGHSRFDDPVMFLSSSSGVGGGAEVNNAGLISSYELPTFSVSGSPSDPPNVPVVALDYDKILGDATDIAGFAGSAGRSGSIDKLSQYAAAAGMNVIDSESGSVSVLNDTTGLLIGRVALVGSSGGEVVEAPLTGNTIVNYGKWLTTDGIDSSTPGTVGPAGNIMVSGGEDAIYNLGLVQTAFKGPGNEGGAVAETTTFILDDFFNGRVPGSADVSGGAGLLSMIDGAPGDETHIQGEYHGAKGAGFNAYLGVDVSFAGDQAASDLLTIGEPAVVGDSAIPVPAGGDVDGSTGIIIHKVSNTPAGVSQDGIVVKAFGADLNPASMQCFGKPCKEGDTFFIASQSSNYVNVNGVGVVQDGFHAWYLTEQQPIPPDPTFVLKSTFATWTGGDAADLVTGAQNIWYDASGVVEDHIYGNHFPLVGGGGGGADLPADDTPTAPGEASRSQSGLWARISGNWTNENSSVSDSVFGTVDTGFDQSTFEVLGGADFSPNGLGSGFRFGLLGGYTTSNIDFATAPESAEYKGGIVGGYAAYTNGGFYADAQVDWNPLDMTFHTAFADVDTNGSSVGVLANTGYRVDRGRFFFEPIGSLTYVSTSVDDTSAGGASVNFSEGQSLRAGAGARIGTSFASSGGTVTEVALLGKVWNEFEDANQVTVSDGAGHTSTFSDNISGVFGEVMASASIYSSDRTMSGFIAGGAKFGADFTSWTAKAGVRRNF